MFDGRERAHEHDQMVPEWPQANGELAHDDRETRGRRPHALVSDHKRIDNERRRYLLVQVRQAARQDSCGHNCGR